MAISLLVSYAITMAGIMILAFLLFLFSISEKTADIGIMIIYILSCFVAGMMMGRKQKTKRYLWGMLIGGIYYCILVFASFWVVSPAALQMTEFITSIIICWLSATLGGMLS